MSTQVYGRPRQRSEVSLHEIFSVDRWKSDARRKFEQTVRNNPYPFYLQLLDGLKRECGISHDPMHPSALMDHMSATDMCPRRRDAFLGWLEDSLNVRQLMMLVRHNAHEFHLSSLVQGGPDQQLFEKIAQHLQISA